MTKSEYREYIKSEVFYSTKSINLITKLRYLYFTPNTNSIYLCRKMWYLYQAGGLRRAVSGIFYVIIARRYGCLIDRKAIVGKGFRIVHPTGIVIGPCIIGENFKILQNCTIGTKSVNDGIHEQPVIGDNVTLNCNSVIIGDINIADNVEVGSNSLVNKNCDVNGGIYVGNPARFIKTKGLKSD